jgi:hypothetical protein
MEAMHRAPPRASNQPCGLPFGATGGWKLSWRYIAISSS